MLEDENVSRMLDILGNKNRRRIIMLLRERPCFVTEISDLLMISPKAVIDHLQLMEREQILSVRYDLNRRKYYYLSNNFQIVISPEAISNAEDEGMPADSALLKEAKSQAPHNEAAGADGYGAASDSSSDSRVTSGAGNDTAAVSGRIHDADVGRTLGCISDIRYLMESRSEILSDLRALESEVNDKILELKTACKEIIGSETELNLVLALAGYEISAEDLSQLLKTPVPEVAEGLRGLEAKGIVERTGSLYRICDNYVR
ncbi:MAG: ArsR family transcriptional regulator [Methanomicrobium sp.]|nr:ArsR family transcriptional regulator [Methanomicrobium sp.]